MCLKCNTLCTVVLCHAEKHVFLQLLHQCLGLSEVSGTDILGPLGEREEVEPLEAQKIPETKNQTNKKKTTKPVHQKVSHAFWTVCAAVTTEINAQTLLRNRNCTEKSHDSWTR